jgi:Fic family protein
MPKLPRRAYAPIFQITPQILEVCGNIMRQVGFLEHNQLTVAQPTLRRLNHIRTVQSTLAIEGNSLSEAQVTALLDGKRVVGPQREIQEVLQTTATYLRVAHFGPASEDDFLAAHRSLMGTLIPESGSYRRGGVGIFKGTQLTHVAPPASRVPTLMMQLFDWLENTSALPVVVVSSIFHYELEFIHPFADGNGRMGRLWQHVILVHSDPLFEYIPFESVIAARQKEYYAVLAHCDTAADCTAFIEFCAGAILESLLVYRHTARTSPATPEQRLVQAKNSLQGRAFSRKDYLSLFRGISTATASRDLRSGLDAQQLTSRGSGRVRVYHFTPKALR